MRAHDAARRAAPEPPPMRGRARRTVLKGAGDAVRRGGGEPGVPARRAEDEVVSKLCRRGARRRRRRGAPAAGAGAGPGAGRRHHLERDLGARRGGGAGAAWGARPAAARMAGRATVGAARRICAAGGLPLANGPAARTLSARAAEARLLAAAPVDGLVHLRRRAGAQHAQQAEPPVGGVGRHGQQLGLAAENVVLLLVLFLLVVGEVHGARAVDHAGSSEEQLCRSATEYMLPYRFQNTYASTLNGGRQIALVSRRPPPLVGSTLPASCLSWSPRPSGTAA
jgi:hypothetical protein